MLDLETIQILISEALEVPKAHVISSGQRGVVADARSLFVYFAHMEGHDLAVIAETLKVKSWQNAKYHVVRVKDLAKRDQIMRKHYALCSKKIKSFKGRK